MTEKEAEALFKRGRVADIKSLQGIWQVTMWGWWRWMSRDEKIITGRLGFNRYLLFGKYIPWGYFTVNWMGNLYYARGSTWDKVVKHPDNPDVMIGSYGKRQRKTQAYKHRAYFLMTRISDCVINFGDWQ